VVGFVVVKLHGDDKMGDAGMIIAMVETGEIRGMGQRVGPMSRRGLGCGRWRGILKSCSGGGGRSGFGRSLWVGVGIMAVQSLRG
jgi:hypothetical protein